MSNHPIKPILAAALREFDAWLKSSGWLGKENDCVNLFAHGFLAKRIRRLGVLHDLAQIGIEVGVPQLQAAGLRRKQAVRKDLVIWGKPRMTTWDSEWRAANIPIAVMEFKARKNSLSAYDLNWLRGFTRQYPRCFGAAVTVDFDGADSRIHSYAVRAGSIDRNWIAK